MILVIIIILFFTAAATMAAIVGVATLRRLRAKRNAGHAAEIEAIDIEAFRNLANPVEETYLHDRLTSVEFRTVRRARLRAVAAYVQAAGRNAAVLIVVGESAMASADPQTVEAARQLVNQALMLRRNAFFVLLRVYVALVWPNARIAAIPILDAYGEMSGSAMLLGRLQNPTVPVRL